MGRVDRSWPSFPFGFPWRQKGPACPPPAPGRCFGVTSERGVRLIGTHCEQAVWKRGAVVSSSAESSETFSTSLGRSNLSVFSCRRRLLVVIPFLGKLLAEAWVQQALMEHLLGVRLRGGGGWCPKLEQCLSFLALHLSLLTFLAAAPLVFPPCLLAGFPFMPLPHLRVAGLLMWKFSSVPAKMCASVWSASVLWLWGRF